MFGGNNNNSNPIPVFLNENRYQLNSQAPNPQLQLFGNLPAGCKVDPVNYLGNEHNSSMLQPHKLSRDAEDFSRQHNLQISLNYNACKEEGDRSASIPNHNPVSTGLRLSYDDDEHNSSVTSASGSMTTTPSILLSLGDNIRSELERQKDEFDQYIKIQEEQLAKGVRDLKQRHMASFLNTIEEGVSKKLQEKETELETMNRKNRELMERIKQVATDAQNWHYRAKYNESMVNILKTNLQNAISQGADQGKEGFGDSEVDDATSYINPANYPPLPSGRGKSILAPGYDHLICKACRSRQVCILLMPCRRLCVCKECDGFISMCECDGFIGMCPVCNIPKSASVEVYLS